MAKQIPDWAAVWGCELWTRISPRLDDWRGFTLTAESPFGMSIRMSSEGCDRPIHLRCEASGAGFHAKVVGANRDCREDFLWALVNCAGRARAHLWRMAPAESLRDWIRSLPGPLSAQAWASVAHGRVAAGLPAFSGELTWGLVEKYKSLILSKMEARTAAE